MQQVAQLAEQVREQRQPVSPDNPLLQWQAAMSERIIAALDGYRDLRDASIERIFLSVYGSPVLQAMLGLAAPDRAAAPRPGYRAGARRPRRSSASPNSRPAWPRAARARRRSARWSTSAWAAQGVDERAFNELREIRAENQGLTLQAFKQVLREQYFSLMLDREAALAAIPKMLPADAASRTRIARGRPQDRAGGRAGEGEKAQRLAQIEKLFGAAATDQAAQAARRARPPGRRAAQRRSESDAAKQTRRSTNA